MMCVECEELRAERDQLRSRFADAEMAFVDTRRELAAREEQVANLQGYIKDRSRVLEDQVERLRAENTELCKRLYHNKAIDAKRS